MSFQAANNADEAHWVSKALGEGEWSNVSGIVPSGFEVYAAVRHPAWRVECTEENLSDLLSGHHCGRPVRWAEVAESDLPVGYGYVYYTERGIAQDRGTQFRRLQQGGWIVEEIPPASMQTLRPGDAWIDGPKEGTLEPDQARTLRNVLARETENSALCWFGIWEGFGYLTEAQRTAPTIEAPDRRWHLFRATLDHLELSLGGDWFEYQTANLAWPDNRNWCLATEIDAEVTYVGGDKDLITAILDEPSLEAVPVRLGDRLASLHDVLTPVVEWPTNYYLASRFE
ncbi:MAG: hypothetical protein OXG24_06955 [Gammaproteobacteria bacterium]|nr:hypothetical protein [Gammaproteobacteria bacterium]